MHEKLFDKVNSFLVAPRISKFSIADQVKLMSACKF